MKYFDHDGEEIGFLEWAIRVNDHKVVCLALDDVGEFTISTVWIGLHFDHHPTDKILIFETVMFDEEGASLDCVRWETKEIALEGHRRMVEQLCKLGFTMTTKSKEVGENEKDN